MQVYMDLCVVLDHALSLSLSFKISILILCIFHVLCVDAVVVTLFSNWLFGAMQLIYSNFYSFTMCISISAVPYHTHIQVHRIATETTLTSVIVCNALEIAIEIVL